ncbi:MAG: SNF2 helicase associated domain-containing protein [Lachnospiraceae bacterium]|nr:SNF2 helicase associated domain-containing protein [Lachnospiraceae bacterium]
MIKATDIRSLCYGNTYNKGRAYFQDGKVKEFRIEPSEENLEVTAEVRGSGRHIYEVELKISPDDDILETSCTCPAFESYWGICKHCVAVAFEYQKEQKRQSTGQAVMATSRHQGTSAPLQRLLYQYAMKNRMNHLGGPDGTVNLECFFQTDRNGLILECRIGTKRMYVVKNLVKLVRDVQEMRQVRYGAGLEFVHDLSAFTEEGQEIFALLENAVVSRYPDYQDSYYEEAANLRYLLLRQDSLEGFLNHYLGRTIRLDEQDIPVNDGNPPLTLTLKETPGGAEIDTEEMEIYTGSHDTFVKKRKKFWRCTPEFVEQVLPVWRAVRRGNGQHYRRTPLFLSREDYGSFCGSVLPALKPFVKVKSGDLNLEDYAPAEPEFSIYLEMPEDLVVKAAARVRYDAEEYDLLTESAPGGVFRNLEREMQVRNALQKYFHEEENASEGKTRRRGRRESLWEDGLPVRDLDEEAVPDISLNAESDWYGTPVRDLDADLQAENEQVQAPTGGRVTARGEEALCRLLEDGLTELGNLAELFVDESIRKLRIQPSPRVTMGIGFAGDFLDLDVQVEGMDPAEIAGILDGYRRRKKYFRLKNGDFLRLEEGGIGALSELADGLDLDGEELQAGHVELEKYRALYLENVLGETGEVRVRKTPDYRRMVRSIRHFSDSEYEVPESLHAELRPYQVQGYQWLSTLCEYGFGGILADDMGLGKTIQVIALLLSHAEAGEQKSSLIVAPASLVYNWESEVQRFAPSLTVQVIAGNAEERKEQMKRTGDYAVNITSYDLLKRDVKEYKELSFDCCVLDEAQYIKNAGTQAAKSAKKIRAAHRFALTGTPIENRLSDLWSIFDFLMPGYLFSYKKFRDEFETAIVKSSDQVAVQRLQRMVTPFLLRRKKGDVLKDLPDKLEEVVYVRMVPEQERIYRASMERLRQDVLRRSDAEIRENRLQILAELTRLRQICCSPRLCFENYVDSSGKVSACLELLRSAAEGGHRVLVFSQFTGMLELLIRYWEQLGMSYLYLSGKDSKLARRSMVEEFQQGEIPVFFISLKAGGTGLNLTAADMVIHVDPWWNVAAQNQATDRAHRIGQEHVVNVMKLVTKDTIEEKIVKLQEKKAALADSVVEGEGVADFTLNREALMELFG